MLRSLVGGVDHVVIAVKNLTKAASAWAALGFTIAPRGLHSAAMGTANHTIMLGPDYLELLSVLKPTATNEDTRKLLSKRDGIERTAFATDDTAGLVKAIKKQGIEPVGPLHFGRPVELPNGKTAEANFSACRWPASAAVAGMSIFACHHHTPKYVWLKHLQQHANGAARIRRIKLVSSEPRQAAQRLAALTGREAKRQSDGSYTVSSGRGRAEFIFVSRALLAKRHEGLPMPDWPENAAVGLAIETGDIAAARRAAGALGMIKRGRLVIPPKHANGLILCFEQG